MRMDRVEKLNHLKYLLKELAKFYGGNAQFVRDFGKKCGKSFNRNLVNNILNGTINFEKGHHEHLDLAIEVALTTLEKLSHLEKDKPSNKLLIPVLHKDASPAFIEEQLSIAEQLIFLGKFIKAHHLLSSIGSIVNLKKLEGYKPYLFGLYCLLSAKTRIQVVKSHKGNQTHHFLQKGVDTFIRLREFSLAFKMYDLYRIFLRQIGENEYAVLQFKEDTNLLFNSFLKESEKKSYQMSIYHQNAISLVRASPGHNKKEDLFSESEKLFKESNEFFGHRDNENWYKHAVIREAELYVKSNQFHKADSILGDFEDYCEIALLTDAQRSSFFKINCEKYLKVGDLTNAMNNFKAGVQISLKNEFQSDLQFLQNLVTTYDLLKSNLPESFTVYDPVWD